MKKNLLFAIFISLGFITINAQPVFYGVAPDGGLHANGTLFKFDYGSDTFVVKNNFDGSNDGQSPYGKLLQASNGKLYGTTSTGGSGGSGSGTLFEFDPVANVYTKKADFDYSTSGSYSYGSLVQLPDGRLIGTCSSGGTYGYGTIFQYDITADTITSLYDFDDANSGSYPFSGLILASNGKLYGLAWSGGSAGFGTLYEFDPLTDSLAVDNSFDYSNGANPIGRLAESNGKLYGVAYQGGANDFGTIFEYDLTSNSFSNRFSFDYSSNGAYPYAGITVASNGLFYGTNIGGGENGIGILFSFDDSLGSANNLHDFDFSNDGYTYCPVMQASDGNLYGMTQVGDGNFGTIYQYNLTTPAYTTVQLFDYDSTGGYPFWTELTELEGNSCESLSATSAAGVISCQGGVTTVTVSATGGTSPYTGTGSYTVTAGTYTYTVTDVHECTTTTTITITEPEELVASSSSGTIACNGGVATVTVSATGGTSPYSGTGTYTVTAGTYSYTVTDAHSCSSTTTITITEPDVLLASSSSGTIACHGGVATVTVSATGGTSPYSGTGTYTVTADTYSYMATDAHGCTSTTTITITEPAVLIATSTADPIACNGGTTTIYVAASGGTKHYTGTGTHIVTAGTYSYVVTDAHGCTSTTSITITEPAVLVASSSSGTLACHGGVATVTVSATGGTSSYSGTGSYTVTAGTYSYTVTDEHGCTSTTSITITEPDVLVPSSSSGTITCNGGTTTVTVSATGGSPSYTGTGTFTVTAGTYSYSVTDSNGCLATTSITITQPEAVSPPALSVVNNCDGTSTITASGVTGTLNWSDSGSGNPRVVSSIVTLSATQTLGGCTSVSSDPVTSDPHTNPSCSISGISTAVHASTNTFTAPSGMDTYTWTVTSRGSIVGSTTGSTVDVYTVGSVGSYVLTLTITKYGCTSTCTKVVSIVAGKAITVYSSLYTIGQGNHPSVTKSALSTNLKVFDSSITSPMDGRQDHYEIIWNGRAGLISGYYVSEPLLTTYGGGATYKYTIIVPANGKYLVLGKAIVSSATCGGSTCTIYTGKEESDTRSYTNEGNQGDNDYSKDAISFHSVLKDYQEKCREGETQEVENGYLLIVTPTMLIFNDSMEHLPVVYESGGGVWQAATAPMVSDKFYVTPEGSLSASIANNEIDAVQFTIGETGSAWSVTKLTHQLKYNDTERTVYSYPVMVNNRSNKLLSINIAPNPANEFVKIALPEFEGSATVNVYNIYGQKVKQQKINIVGDTSVVMDVSLLPAGVYVIAAENSSGRVTGRLVKQ